MPETQKQAPRIACFLATSGHSGVDRVMGNLLPALAEAGYPLDLLQIRGHGPHLDKIPPGMRLIRLRARHVYTAWPELVTYLWRNRPQLLLCDKDRVNRIAALACLCTPWPVRLALRLGTTMSINLAHRSATERWLQRQSIHWLYRRAHRILMPSQGAADDLSEQFGIAPQRIAVTPSPIVTPEFRAKMLAEVTHPWLQEGAPPLILGIGELCMRKDFATLLRAFATIAPLWPGNLMILGEGKRRASLLELAQQLGIHERLAMPGFVANPYPYLRRAALFVLSSRWEGMPVVLIEALACGTPVAATDCPSGPREILRQGEVGALAPVGDAAALGQAMLTQLRNPPDRELLQAAAAPYQLENSLKVYLQALGLPSSPTVA